MKFLPLLVKNVFRNRRRTLLTITTVAVSLFLVAALRTVLTELENPPIAPEGALRLVTRHKISLANVLPISYREKIAQIRGVETVCATQWFGGEYKTEVPWFAQFAVDADSFVQLATELKLPESQKKAFVADRTGALVAKELAARIGWKVGDRVNLRGTVFSWNPELTIRGIYEEGDQNSMYFHWDYFNEGVGNWNVSGTFGIKVKSIEDVPRVAEEIDRMFENSTAPTKTESEKAFVLSFVSMIGNVQFLITSICTVVIFTIVLVAANTMAMSIRERAHEIGILKAVGFRRGQVLSLLISESLFIALAGALIGSVSARLIFGFINMNRLTNGFMQRFYVTPGTLLICAGIGILVGILAAGVPSWSVARRPVAQALRRLA